MITSLYKVAEIFRENGYLKEDAELVWVHENANKLFVVRRGQKPKKYKDRVNDILEDLKGGLSIRKCADKYDCSTRTIQQIKRGEY